MWGWGKVGYLGLSEAAPATIRRAHRVYPISALRNIGALNIRLSPEELTRLNEVFPKGGTAGNRYADMSTVNR